MCYRAIIFLVKIIRWYVNIKFMTNDIIVMKCYVDTYINIPIWCGVELKLLTYKMWQILLCHGPRL